MYQRVDELAIVESQAAADKIKKARGNADKVAQIEDDYQEKLVDNEIFGITQMLELNDEFHFLSLKQEEDFNEKLRALKKRRNEMEFDDFKKLNKAKLEEQLEYLKKTQEIINAGFEFQQQLSDNQLDRATRTHEIELASAQESAEGKMIADAKYDKKKREIDRNQAVLKKAQGAFNVVIDTATAVMTFLAAQNYGMAILSGILGGIQLGTVLAQQIPAYAEGVTGAKGGLSLMGEEGHELVEEPSGKTWITDDKATLYNIAPGSNVYPNDEIQKILAQQAFNNSFNILGIGETNNLLKSIDKNTKDQVWFEGNRKYVKHGTITTEYATRGR
jgi:hypothetical protein